MCFNPITIRVRTSQFSDEGCQPLYIKVPCGHCGECRSAAKSQWYLRNYWQVRECIDFGGFVLFDTLTYRDSTLPHISDYFPEFKDTELDFSCFSKNHIVNFMKRLRKNLSTKSFEKAEMVLSLKNQIKDLEESKKQFPLRKQSDRIKNRHQRDIIDQKIKEKKLLLKDYYKMGYDIDDNFDAFVVCEYGKDEYYQDDNGRMRKATFRPHYHVLFYSRVPDLTPTKLAEYIYKSWKKGRTDNYDEFNKIVRPKCRVRNTVGKGSVRTSDEDMRKISNYVAKYICKDGPYEKKLFNRIESICASLFGHESIDGLQSRIDEFLDWQYFDFLGRSIKMGPTEVYTPIKKDVSVSTAHFYKGQEDRIRRFLNNAIGGFHYQPEGFGLYALDDKNFKMDDWMNGYIEILDNRTIVRHIDVPRYYLTKRYFDLEVSDWTGNKVYTLKPDMKDEYFQWKENFYSRLESRYVENYTKYYYQLSGEERAEVDRLLDGRSLRDFAEYVIYFKGRVCPSELWKMSKIDMLHRHLSHHPYKDNDFAVVNGDICRFDVYEENMSGDERQDFGNYAFENSINMWSDSRFMYFDWIYDIFAGKEEKDNEEKRLAYENQRDVCMRLYNAGFKTKIY